LRRDRPLKYKSKRHIQRQEKGVMSVLVQLPQLAANVDEATVGLWKRAEGDALAAGEALVEIITSKATFDLESPADGILLKCIAPTNSIVPVGYVLAVVGDPGEEVPDVAAGNDTLMAGFRGRATAAERNPAPKVRATPGARRLAKEAGIDLGEVFSNAGGHPVREEDVRKFLDQRAGS
jgi:pyruvate dehydrogenase E2 component (dihydrolipoamide acetyltransferase)